METKHTWAVYPALYALIESANVGAVSFRISRLWQKIRHEIKNVNMNCRTVNIKLCNVMYYACQVSIYIDLKED